MAWRQSKRQTRMRFRLRTANVVEYGKIPIIPQCACQFRKCKWRSLLLFALYKTNSSKFLCFASLSVISNYRNMLKTNVKIVFLLISLSFWVCNWLKQWHKVCHANGVSALAGSNFGSLSSFSRVAHISFQHNYGEWRSQISYHTSDERAAVQFYWANWFKFV